MKAKDFRMKAKELVAPYSSTLALIELVVFVASLILGGLGLIPYAGAAICLIIVVFVGFPITFSYVHIVDEVNKKGTVRVESIFEGFKRYGQALVLSLLQTIFIFLWTLLLIVPGIIKSYAYSMTLYIGYHDPKISANDAITKSRQLMHGNKWRLFCLDISYIGWFLLSLLTLGILLLWVCPKHRQARYSFYLDLLSKQEKPESVVEKKVEVKEAK